MNKFVKIVPCFPGFVKALAYALDRLAKVI
jgi:hypothetical protein